METSFGLFFFLRQSRNPQAIENGNVYVRITVNGERSEISTKRKCESGKWNSTSGRLNGKTEDVRQFNKYLNTFQQKIYEAKRRLIETDQEVTAEAIKWLVLGIDTSKKKYMILEIFRLHNQQMKELIGKQYAQATFIRFETTLRHTKNFFLWKYQMEDLDIHKLNYELITQFEFWFKSVRNCDHNTTMKYLSNFRKIVNYCLKNGWLPKDPFLGFVMSKKEVRRTALTEYDLKAIAGREFSANIKLKIFFYLVAIPD